MGNKNTTNTNTTNTNTTNKIEEFWNSCHNNDSLPDIQSKIEALSNKDDINWQNPNSQNTTALYWASKNNNTGLVQFLLQNGANPNLSDKDGYTPLYMSSSNGHIEVVKLLLQNKADVNKADNKGNTPLYAAAFSKNGPIVTLLLENGAKTNTSDIESNDDLKNYIMELSPKLSESPSTVPLPIATLVPTSSSPNISDPKEDFWNSFYSNDKLSDIKVKIAALGIGDINWKNPKHQDTTALYWASRNGNIDLVNFLLENGADPNLETRHEITPLFIAGLSKNDQLIKRLVESGAKINTSKVNEYPDVTDYITKIKTELPLAPGTGGKKKLNKKRKTNKRRKTNKKRKTGKKGR